MSTEPDFWRSIHCREDAHYNTLVADRGLGMSALRTLFPEAKADAMNFCLFSTSGVHGTYSTIEDAEEIIIGDFKDFDAKPATPHVTFLVVHPRQVCLRYGNCHPLTRDDIEFLKKLRQSSWDAVLHVGRSKP